MKNLKSILAHVISCLCLIAVYDIHGTGTSLLFFGEPEFPSEK